MGSTTLSKRKGHAGKLKTMPMPTIDLMELALRMHRGNIAKAAEELSLEPPVLRRKINVTPSLIKVLQDIKQNEVDNAESQLYNLVDQGNPQATIFVLKTLGKDRGFTEKTLVEHDVTEGVKSAAALVASMRNGAKQIAQDDEDDVIDVQATVLGVDQDA